MTNNEKNTAAIVHLSTLSQYIIPFGNYIFPTIIWSAKKDDSEFINQTGKNVLNFQLSIFLYSVLLLIIAVPLLIFTILKNKNFELFFDGNHNFEFLQHQQSSGLIISLIIAVFLIVLLKVTEFILIVKGALIASEGQLYRYPLSLNFIK
ncbi:MAG: DUF4870 domain-containing protein [Flavobacterium sp.]|nr:DUF4870 domain-containing protein [Flavobacterium sp.]